MAMIKSKNTWQCVAGICGFTAVAMGAIGAHAVSDAIFSGLIEKASFYQLIHAVVLLWLSGQSGTLFRISRWLFLTGIVLFCGSLYAKGLTGLPHVTAVAPFGGSCLMAGWLAIGAAKNRQP